MFLTKDWVPLAVDGFFFSKCPRRSGFTFNPSLTQQFFVETLTIWVVVLILTKRVSIVQKQDKFQFAIWLWILFLNQDSVWLPGAPIYRYQSMKGYSIQPWTIILLLTSSSKVCIAVRYAPETGVKSLSTSLMTQSRYLRLTMVSSLSSPSGNRQPLWRRPLALSSSLNRSRTGGWRRSCMMREVLALAVVAKAANISSMVDSCGMTEMQDGSALLTKPFVLQLGHYIQFSL